MVVPVVVATTAPKEKTAMTKVEDRTVVRLAKEALLADRDGLKALFRGGVQKVREAERTAAVGASKGERTEGRLGYRSGYYARGDAAWEDRAACPAGPLLDGAVRALSAFGQSAGCGASGDGRSRGADAESEGDHRGACRTFLFGIVDFGNRQEARQRALSFSAPAA